MSADRAYGLTGRDIAEALADTPLDDDSSAPTRPYGAPNIGVDTPAPWLNELLVTHVADGHIEGDEQ